MYFCPAKIETDVTRLQETERDEKKKCYRIVTEIRNKPITLEKIDIGNQLLEKSVFENMERRFVLDETPFEKILSAFHKNETAKEFHEFAIVENQFIEQSLIEVCS